MNPNLRVLKVHHFGETPVDDLDVSIAAMLIKIVTTKDGMAQNRPIKITTLFFLDDSEPVELNLSEFDTLQIESVVASYGFQEF